MITYTEKTNLKKDFDSHTKYLPISSSFPRHSHESSNMTRPTKENISFYFIQTHQVIYIYICYIDKQFIALEVSNKNMADKTEVRNPTRLS